jgi:acetylornithine deacetylase/succinyl-diaminopimelate desuccinylase-like protein
MRETAGAQAVYAEWSQLPGRGTSDAKGQVGRDVGQMRNAGGSPASLLHDVIGAPIILFGTGLPEDHWHDSDESVRVDMLQAGAATLALVWPRLAGTT